MKRLNTSLSDTDAVLDSLNDGVVTIGLDKRVMYLNRAAQTLLGYTLDEARNLPCSEVVHCAACESDCLLDRTLSSGRGILRYETRLQDRNGRVVAVTSNTALLHDTEGNVVGGVEIIRDCSPLPFQNEELKGQYSFENLVGKSPRMREIFGLIPSISETDHPVLIQGGIGTGKELVARAIHDQSPRRGGPFVKCHCGALADHPLSLELSGRGRPGETADGTGLAARAVGGTLFLDEIGGIGPEVQDLLYRLISAGEIRNPGETSGARANVRVIAATHRDLEAAVRDGTFRRDLYDLLRAVSIPVPLLRERRNDIPLLIRHFLNRCNLETGKRIESVSPEAVEALLNYDYPGNIRELESIIEHAVVSCQETIIRPQHLPKDLFYVRDDFVDQAINRADPLKALERQLVLRVLSQTGWRLQDAAKRLKISRTTLWRRIKELGIDRLPSKESESQA